MKFLRHVLTLGFVLTSLLMHGQTNDKSKDVQRLQIGFGKLCNTYTQLPEPSKKNFDLYNATFHNAGLHVDWHIRNSSIRLEYSFISTEWNVCEKYQDRINQVPFVSFEDGWSLSFGRLKTIKNRIVVKLNAGFNLRYLNLHFRTHCNQGPRVHPDNRVISKNGRIGPYFLTGLEYQLTKNKEISLGANLAYIHYSSGEFPAMRANLSLSYNLRIQ